MAIFDLHHPLVFTFGVLGNLVSIFVYLAPLPTFMEIYRKKSTLGYQSLPYVVALFSAMLWMYYACLKSNAALLISINSFGCVVETIYITIYLVYASREARNHTAKLLASLNAGLFSAILLATLFLVKGSRNRVLFVGWACVAFSVAVFAAPLSIVFQVVRTRSVEYMPFALSFLLTLSAIVWFSYGLLLKDVCIAVPNVLGFLLGLIQMILYGAYRNAKEVAAKEKIVNNQEQHVIDIVMLGNSEVHPVDPQSSGNYEKNVDVAEEDEEEEHEQTDGGHEKDVASAINEPSRAIVQLESPVLVVCAA